MGRENAYARSVSRRYSHLPTERIDRGETYFALQNDGSFTSDIIMVEAHKAA